MDELPTGQKLIQAYFHILGLALSAGAVGFTILFASVSAMDGMTTDAVWLLVMAMTCALGSIGIGLYYET